MVKHFSWNIIPWNALLFEKILKQFMLNTRVGFPVIFSQLRWPIEPKFSQVCYFIHTLWYTKCWPLDNTVYWTYPMALSVLYVKNDVHDSIMVTHLCFDTPMIRHTQRFVLFIPLTITSILMGFQNIGLSEQRCIEIKRSTYNHAWHIHVHKICVVL